jgi:hypothetical protein
MATNGVVQRVPLDDGSDPMSLVAGTGGSLWFTEAGANNVGLIAPDGTLTEFSVPSAGSQPFGIANGPRGLWFTEAAGDNVGLLNVVTDDTPPVITISSPLEGAVVVQGSTLTADFSCADEDGGSGLASCDGTVADGGLLDTSTAGTHVLTVTATDNAANAASASAGYVVVAGITGGLAAKPAVTPVNAGSAVPVGLNLGVKGAKSDLGAWATWAPVDCAHPSVALGPSVSAGKVNVSNGGHVEVVWKTSKSSKGGCAELSLGFGAAGWNTASAAFLVSFS